MRVAAEDGVQGQLVPPEPLSSHLADALYSEHHVPLDWTAVVYRVQTRKRASGQAAEPWPFVSPMSGAQPEPLPPFSKSSLKREGFGRRSFPAEISNQPLVWDLDH